MTSESNSRIHHVVTSISCQQETNSCVQNISSPGQKSIEKFLELSIWRHFAQSVFVKVVRD